MATLNWGPEPYGRFKPHYRESDKTTEIPDTGLLGFIPIHYLNLFLPFSEAEPRVQALKLKERTDSVHEDAVFFPLKKGEQVHEHDAILLWANNRQELIAILHNLWLENFPDKDEDYTGPFRLDEYCKLKLLDACRVHRDLIGLMDVRKTSPRGLEALRNSLKASELKGKSGNFLSHAFSIRYFPWGGDDLDEYTIDWSGRKWKKYCREEGASWHPWKDHGDIDTKAYTALLDSFGLDSSKLSLEQIALTHPRQLAIIGTKNPRSATLEDDRYASEVFSG